MVVTKGIKDHRIHETPIAVLDFETTGLNPGSDRVIEISVVKYEPGREPYLAFDTLVNPLRPMVATEITTLPRAPVAKTAYAGAREPGLSLPLAKNKAEMFLNIFIML